MNQGSTIFSQILAFADYEDFRSGVRRYGGDRGTRRLSCWEQFLAMAFAQLTHRESLRDIEVSLAAHRDKLYHSGFRNPVRRSTLSDANETRDWRIYADFAHRLIRKARPLYADTDLGLDLDGVLYALDASVIDLSLTLFPWVPFQRSRAAVKLHTLFDVATAIPVLIDITGARGADSHVLDRFVPEPGCFIVMDRGYIDFPRLYRLNQELAFFVVRAKGDLQFRRRYSHPVDRSSGLRSDQTVVLTGRHTRHTYPASLAPRALLRRRYRYLFRLRHQQLLCAGPDHRQHLSPSLECRIVLQVDQAASTNQTLPWELLQRCQNSNLDCHRRLRPNRDYQETPRFGPLSLHNSPGFQYHHFREKPHSTGVSAL